MSDTRACVPRCCCCCCWGKSIGCTRHVLLNYDSDSDIDRASHAISRWPDGMHAALGGQSQQPCSRCRPPTINLTPLHLRIEVPTQAHPCSRQRRHGAGLRWTCPSHVKKVAHTRLPSAGCRSGSRFLAVSLQVM